MSRKEKPVQFPMDSAAYGVLKKRAKTLGISTGQMVENLLSSFEFRLKWAYKVAGVDQRTDEMDGRFMGAFLLADKVFMSESQRIKLIKNTAVVFASKEEWEPTINIPRDKFRGATLRKDGLGATWMEGDNITEEMEKEIIEEMKRRREQSKDEDK